MLKLAFKVLVSVSLVFLAVRLLDFSSVLHMVRTGSLPLFALAILITLLVFACMGLRWYWMVCRLLPLTFTYHLAIYFKATFLNSFTPANLGGDVYRLAILRSPDIRSGQLITLLIQERILGLYGYLVLYLLAWSGLPGSWQFDLASPFTWGALIAMAAIFAPLIAIPVIRLVHGSFPASLRHGKLAKAVSIADNSIALLSSFSSLKLLAITLVSTALWIVAIKTVAVGMHIPVSFGHLAAVGTLAEIMRMIPLTVQGVGVREGVFAYLLGLLSYQPELGYAVGGVAYLGLSVTIVLAGPIGSILELSAGTPRRVKR